MPSFDEFRLSQFERSAYLARLDRDGPGDIESLFAAITARANLFRDKLGTPEQVAAEIMSGIYDDEHIVARGPAIRHETIVLAWAMVRQILESDPPTLSPLMPPIHLKFPPPPSTS